MKIFRWRYTRNWSLFARKLGSSPGLSKQHRLRCVFEPRPKTAPLTTVNTPYLSVIMDTVIRTVWFDMGHIFNQSISNCSNNYQFVHHWCCFKNSFIVSTIINIFIRKNKRFIHYQSIIQKVLNWISSVPSNSSIPEIDCNDLEKLQLFPESFVLLLLFFLSLLWTNIIFFFIGIIKKEKRKSVSPSPSMMLFRLRIPKVWLFVPILDILMDFLNFFHITLSTVEGISRLIFQRMNHTIIESYVVL